MRERNLENGGRRLDIVMLAVLREDWTSPLNQ